MPDLTKPEVLALIPARGGSKGLPRKNLLPLGGVPLLGRAIETAHACDTITRVIVSTEDDEIAEVARSRAAEVPFRRAPELATDAAPMLDVVRDALRRLEDSEGYRPDLIALLQANSPFTRADDVDATVQTVLKENCDVAYTVCKLEHPPFWAQTLDENGSPEFFVDERRIPGFDRRQDLPSVFRPTGAVSVMRVEYFWSAPEGKPRFCMPRRGQRTRTVVMDPLRSLDIDTEADYLLAQAALMAVESAS